MKSPGTIFGWLIGIIVFLTVLPDLLVWWHGVMVESTADLSEPMRTLMSFVFDPFDYVWKWFVGLVAVVVGGIYAIARRLGW